MSNTLPSYKALVSSLLKRTALGGPRILQCASTCFIVWGFHSPEVCCYFTK